MKKEEIYVVIDNDEKRDKAVEILTDAGESIWSSADAMYYKLGAKYLIFDTVDMDWYTMYSDDVGGLTEISLDQLGELLRKEENFEKLVEVLNEELTEESFKKILNPQQHYSNELKQFRSLFELSHILKLNEWEFDILKRLVRCRKKNQFKEDLQKIKDTIDIYLNEYSE